jgi:integrase
LKNGIINYYVMLSVDTIDDCISVRPPDRPGGGARAPPSYGVARHHSRSERPLIKLMRRLGRAESVHGFRATFKTWANERTAFSNHAIELTLAHTIGSQVEQAYQRGELRDTRRQLLDAWAIFCLSPVADTGSGNNVVPMR